MNAKNTSNSSIVFLFPLAILVAITVSFWPVVKELLQQWDSGDNSYAYAIIPIFFYLCWDIRDQFKFVEFSWSWFGIPLVIFSALLVFIGFRGSFQSIAFVGIWLCLIAILVTLYGTRARHIFFPIMMLAFIVPLPPVINTLLTFKLKMLASTISVKMFRLIGLSVFQEGNIIDLGIEKLQVVDACSGLRYFMSLIVISLMIGYLFNKGWWRRLFLVLLVIPLSSLVNGLRIFLMGMLINNGLKQYTEGAYHDLTGVLVFLFAGAMLVVCALILKRIGPASSDKKITDHGCERNNLLKPLLFTSIFCLTFITASWTLHSDPHQFRPENRKPLSSFPMQIDAWVGEKHILAEDVMESLHADDYISATFINRETGNTLYFLIPYYLKQTARYSTHSPQTCLLGAGWSMDDTRERTITAEGGMQIPLKTIHLTKDSTKMFANYFFFQRGRTSNSIWENKLFLMWDSITKNRSDGALVRVEIILTPNQSDEEAMQLVDQFINRIWPLLPEYIPM